MKVIRLPLALAAIAALCLAGQARANVNLKNGNFSIIYTDILYSGGFEPQVERVYNSRTAFKGSFGWGWGFEYEAYLTVSGDRTVTIHEYGGGAENIFDPGDHQRTEVWQADVEREVTAILGANKKEIDAMTAAARADYQSRLESDATFRHDEWTRLKDRVKPPTIEP